MKSYGPRACQEHIHRTHETLSWNSRCLILWMLVMQNQRQQISVTQSCRLGCELQSDPSTSYCHTIAYIQFYQCQAGSTCVKQVRIALSDPHSSSALFSIHDDKPALTTQVTSSPYSLSILCKHQCPRKMAKFI